MRNAVFCGPFEHKTCNCETSETNSHLFCLPHLGIYKVFAYHGYEDLNILRKAFIGQGQSSTWIFSSSRSNYFVTGGFSISHTKII